MGEGFGIDSWEKVKLERVLKRETCFSNRCERKLEIWWKLGIIGNRIFVTSWKLVTFFYSFFDCCNIRRFDSIFRSDRVLTGFIRMEFGWTNCMKKNSRDERRKFWLYMGSMDETWQRITGSSDRAMEVEKNRESFKETMDRDHQFCIEWRHVSQFFIVPREKQACQNAPCSCTNPLSNNSILKKKERKKKSGRFVRGRALASTETERTEKDGETRWRRAAWP